MTSNNNPFNQEENQPLIGGSQQNQQIPPTNVENPGVLFGDRPKNFPRCRPTLHHNITTDFPEEKRTVIRRAYFGWYLHVFALFWNAVCLTAALAVGSVLGGFFIGLIAFLLGTLVSFYVYWCFYSAVRKQSGAYFVWWFILFAVQIGIEILYGIGIGSTGGGGFLMMIEAFSKNRIAIGVMCALNTGFFAGVTLYNLNLLRLGRNEYKSSGGNKAASKEIAQGAWNVAYDNRETIKQVAKDNKDVIKQVVVENKDTIISFAKDHKEDIARVAVDNKDTIWENREAIASVFDNQK